MDVTHAVLNFRDHLNAGYASWLGSAQACLERDRGFLDEAFYDWAQANWELLVERPLCATGEFLEIYGAGSDYEAELYSRVFFHGAKPTHEIFCEAAHGDAVVDVLSGRSFNPSLCSFDRFVAKVDTWYDDEPPFDYVLLSVGTTEHMAPVTAIRFALRAVRDGA